MDLSGIPKLKTVVLDENCSHNKEYPIKGLEYGQPYAILGEIDYAEGHYILVDFTLKTPRILPGMFEIYRFREPKDEET